jgi:hypothetical protein
MNLEFSVYISEKHLMQTDGQTDMTKIIVAFRNFANAPKIVGKLVGLEA